MSNLRDRALAVYLRPDTKLEPLIGNWYAWPHLLSPVLYALNMAFRYIPLLKSFVANPAIHVASARDPKFLCAPFAQLTAGQVGQVRELLRTTLERNKDALRFAEDLVNLDRRLQAHARGDSLDSFYDTLPESLSGLVELTYDLNNHPSLRILEELAYRTDWYDISNQSIALFCDPRRAFFLNTPRFDNSTLMTIALPFKNKSLDTLSDMRRVPRPFDEICMALGISDERRQLFRNYFREEPPERRITAVKEHEIRVRYFGHASILIQSAFASLLIDPTVAWYGEAAEGQLTFEDLPDFIDCVFLTHNHQDHVCLEVLLQLRARIGEIVVAPNNLGCIGDPSLALMLTNLGFPNVTVATSLARRAVANGYMMSIPFLGEHASLSMLSKHGLYIRLREQSFMFLADSDCVDRGLYKRIRKLIETVDVLFIGMECHGAPLSWLYGPYLSSTISRRDDEARRLSGSNSKKAWAAVEELRPKQVYVYAMGQEPWLTYLLGLQYDPGSVQIIESQSFIEQCKASGISAERLNGTRELHL
jgi:L-ascorbate metabolism protein UlaG (beta-lactamase superfamily)